MGKENWLSNLLVGFLKKIGLIKTYEVSKKEMCESAKKICNRNCDSCAWNENR